jgi:hypothetical protein
MHGVLIRLRGLGMSFDIEHIDRALNKVADGLAKAAADGHPQRGDAPIPGTDVGSNPNLQTRSWRWTINGKSREVAPFTVRAARHLLQARSWPGNALGKRSIITPTRWTPPGWPAPLSSRSDRMWATMWRNIWNNKNSSWEKTTMWRLAHGALPLPPMGGARPGCPCCEGGWVDTVHLFECPATAGARFWIHHLMSTWYGSILPPFTVLHWMGAATPREISKMPKPNIAMWHSIRTLLSPHYGLSMEQHYPNVIGVVRRTITLPTRPPMQPGTSFPTS